MAYLRGFLYNRVRNKTTPRRAANTAGAPDGHLGMSKEPLMPNSNTPLPSSNYTDALFTAMVFTVVR